MIWKKCELQKAIPSSVDALGNPVMTYSTILATKARITSYDEILVKLGDRDVTKDTRFIVIPREASYLPRFERIVLEGNIYIPSETIALDTRYSIVVAEVYKP